MPEMRAVPEEVDVARNEKCEFLPFCNPKQVIIKDGKIVAIEFFKTEKGTCQRAVYCSLLVSFSGIGIDTILYSFFLFFSLAFVSVPSDAVR
jgi:hypothetical protein